MKQDTLFEVILKQGDAPLYITTRVSTEVFSKCMEEFKTTDEFNRGEFTDETILEFLEGRLDYIEPFDIFPTAVIDLTKSLTKKQQGIMDEFNLITDDREIEFISLDELTYQWKGEELIELYIEDFYTGDCIVEIDEEFCEPRYFISLNYEVIYLDGIEEKK